MSESRARRCTVFPLHWIDYSRASGTKEEDYYIPVQIEFSVWKLPLKSYSSWHNCRIRVAVSLHWLSNRSLMKNPSSGRWSRSCRNFYPCIALCMLRLSLFFLIASILIDPSEASDNCMRCPLPLSIKEVKSVSEESSVDLWTSRLKIDSMQRPVVGKSSFHLSYCLHLWSTLEWLLSSVNLVLW